MPNLTGGGRLVNVSTNNGRGGPTGRALGRQPDLSLVRYQPGPRVSGARDQILSNRASGRELPTDARRQIAVDNNGDIVDRSNGDQTSTEHLSEVHQGTFA